jgi:phosphoribosylanthranilate isomerase
MTQEDSALTQVKICGITCLEDAMVAAEAGADLLGFIFYAPSPRYVTPQRAQLIIGGLRGAGHTVGTVGVFVDEELGRVKAVMASCGLDYAQLHGDEPPDYVAAVGDRAIKALRLRSEADVARLESYQAAAYLLDAYHPTLKGGTGATWDWRLATGAKRLGRIILAGGLTPDNVAGAIRAARPYGVDASSGVESQPGRKDANEVRRFVMAAKGALSMGIEEGDSDAA